MDLLVNMAFPVTVDNIEALQAWASGEGSDAKYNPLDTTEWEPGSTVLPGNTANVRNYTSYNEGLVATVQTLKLSYYIEVVAALKEGDDPDAVFAAVARSPWGTKAFDNPAFQALGNFPAGSWPTTKEPTILADLGASGISGGVSTVAVGPDNDYTADAFTAAEVYAGILPSSALAGGQEGTVGGTTYIPVSNQPGCSPADYTLAANSTDPEAIEAVEWALKYCGIPYEWGGQADGTVNGVLGAAGANDPGMDCSGMVENAYWHTGFTYLASSRVANAEWEATPLKLPISQAEPGDLVVFGTPASASNPGGFHHIGIVLDPAEDLMIDEPDTGSVDRIDNWTGFGDVWAVVARPELPTVASVSPGSGPLAGGTMVTITGTAFGGPMTVDFGGQSVSATVTSPTSLVAVVPAGPADPDYVPETVGVTVATVVGTSTNSGSFTYIPPPRPTTTTTTPLH
jgi:cell wall-associated NlpC family hydrolase